MYIYIIRSILTAIRKFSQGDITLFQLADALGIAYPRLETLFLSAGLIDIHCDYLPQNEYQDIVNVIMLYLSMSKSVSFKTIDWHIPEKEPV